ncbi:MAG: hypothetical protein HMLKMBBP_01885 [Planctomycetes bacterium]|nr:hypothetical protein [Planctomycetota bacterium]
MSTLAVTFTLIRPWWMLLLLAIPVFAWLALRGRKTRTRAGDVAAITARGLLLAILALALSLPRFERETRYRATAFVLDLSDSVPKDALDDAKEFVRRSASLRGEDDDASFLVFADGAVVEAPMSRISATERIDPTPIDPKSVKSRIPTGETDVSAALRLAQAGFQPGGSRRVVLLTDGNETRGDALAAAKELMADGTRVTVVPVRYERDREVLVQKVVAPATSLLGARQPVRVVVWSSHDGVPAKVRCKVDGVEGGDADVKLSRGTNAFELTVDFRSEGVHRIEASVEPQAADGDPVNNRGAAATIVRGRGRVLLVTQERGGPLERALSEDFDQPVDVAGIEGVPEDAGGWIAYDAVVLDNVPAFGLSDVQRRVMASAVRELGVGIVAIGGVSAFAAGGYLGTEFDEILPVSSDVQNRRVLPSGAMVIVLHSCEFPNGNAKAREITKAALAALSTQDEAGVIEWNGTDHWVVPFQRLSDKARAIALVDGSESGDMPSFDSCLEEAAKVLERSTAAVKHVLMISDGDSSLPSDRLLTRIKDSIRATISTVCVEPHGLGGDGSFASLSRATGGRHYLVRADETDDKLPQIFVKEAVTVRKSAWTEAPFTPVMTGVHRMTKDIAAWPQLLGHVVATAKPEAEVLLTGPDDDPILATWRHGLAQSTAFTSDAHPRWASEWVNWSGFSRFWCQVVRASLRSVDRPGVRVTTEIDGGTARVVLDALHPDGGFRNGLRVSGRVVAPDGTTTDFRATQTGQGRYEGSLPAQQVGTYLAALTWTDPAAGPDAAPEQAAAAICVAYSAEHLAMRSNERLFAQLEAAGADLIDVDGMDAARARDASAPDPAAIPWTGPMAKSLDAVELWPWLAGLAALMLVADVAVRRVRIPWEKFRRVRVAAPPKGRAASGGPPVRASGAFDAGAAAEAARTPTDASPSGAPEPPAAAQHPSPPDAESLLEAKRRARKKQTWEENRP